MSTSIGWVDFSARHRSRTRDVLAMLEEPGMVDELGIGTIRDALADQLFPGISTIQTRAKYFCIIPKLLKDYEKLTPEKRRQESLDDFLKGKERSIRVLLNKKHKEGARGTGIIGASFGQDTEKGVQRPPSSIYWHGLTTFGIVHSELSLASFGKKLQQATDTGNEVTDHTDTAESRNTGNSLIDVPPDHMPLDKHDLDIKLSRQEAEWLAGKIRDAFDKPKPLLCWLLDHPQEVKDFRMLQSSGTEGLLSDWKFGRFKEDFSKKIEPKETQDDLMIAYHFSRAMAGAHILYNYLLQKDREEGQKYENHWNEWRDDILNKPLPRNLMDELNRRVSESGRKIKPYTGKFIKDWLNLDLTRQEQIPKRAEELVRRQECYNKKGRARLREGNPDPSPEKWVGIKHLEYRITQALRIVSDIHEAT